MLIYPQETADARNLYGFNAKQWELLELRDKKHREKTFCPGNLRVTNSHLMLPRANPTLASPFLLFFGRHLRLTTVKDKILSWMNL